jgi:CHAT domain-containing protein/tetratricopeptide (TPR) repeat protein
MPIACRRCYILRILLVAIAAMPLTSTARAQSPASAQQLVLAERDRLAERSQMLAADGDLTGAIQAAQAMLAIERRVLPEGHPDQTGSLEWLAGLYEQQDDFTQAVAMRRELLAIMRRSLPDDDWHVTDAKLALADTQGRARMSPADRAQLAEAARLNLEVTILHSGGQYAKAIELARRALLIREAKLGKDHPFTAQSLNNLAGVLEAQGDHTGARELHERALAIFEAKLGREHPGTALALNNLAMQLEAQGDNRGARKLLERALVIREATLGKDDPMTATTMSNLANQLVTDGDYAGARRLYESALAIFEIKLGKDHPTTATCLTNLALLLEDLGEYDSARQLHQRALVITEARLPNGHPDIAKCLDHLAGVLRTVGDYAGARAHCERALAILETALPKNHPFTLATLIRLAELCQAEGDYAGARSLYDRALSGHEATLGNDHPDTASSLSNLAGLLRVQGDYATARVLLERALAIREAKPGNDRPDIAVALNNLALVVSAQGDRARSRQLLERALSIQEAKLGADHPRTAGTLSNLATVLADQHEYDAAQRLHDRALAIREAKLPKDSREIAESLNNLGSVVLAQGDCARARRITERAVSISEARLGKDHPDTASYLNNLATAFYAEGDYASARRCVENGLNVSRENVDRAAVVQSEREQIVILNHFRDRLDNFLSIAPRAGATPAQTYTFILVWKGAVLERQSRERKLQRQMLAEGDSELLGLLDEHRGVVARLSTLALADPDPRPNAALGRRRELERLSKQEDDLERDLATRSATFRSAQAAARITPSELAAKLPRGSALVDFLEYTHSAPTPGKPGRFDRERRVVAFVVRPDRDIARVDLGPANVINTAIDAWLPSLRRRGPYSGGGAAARVRRLIWGALQPHVEGVGTILVSPSGKLAMAPLGALPGKVEGTYLIEDYEIVFVPVPHMLRDSSDASNKPPLGEQPSLLLVGNVDYGGDAGAAEKGVSRSAAVPVAGGRFHHFTKLEDTAREIAMIDGYFRSRFTGAVADTLSRDKPTESLVRKASVSHRYLHLATHGFFEDEANDPPSSSSRTANGRAELGLLDSRAMRGPVGCHPGLRSGLAMAGANVQPTPEGKDDGILTALEVACLDLSGVELAVLSACETALGKAAGGEGLLGLQRAFQAAGAQSVVGTLWQIPDSETMSLITRFYKNIWEGSMSPRAALRQAQLQILREGCRKDGNTAQDGAAKSVTKSRGGEPLFDASDKAIGVPPYYWAAFVLSTDRP